MKQLNNTKTGEIITYQKSKESGIFYTIWENSFYRDQNLHGISKRCDAFDPNIELNKSLFEGETLTNAEVEELLSYFKIQEVEIDFELSDELRNWYISKGSTTLDTLFRLFITNKAYDNALKAKNTPADFYYPLWMVISFGTENIDSKFSQITDYSIVLYLEELLPKHQQILEMYVDDDVLIQIK